MRFFTSLRNKYSAYSSPNVQVREYNISCNSNCDIYHSFLYLYKVFLNKAFLNNKSGAETVKKILVSIFLFVLLYFPPKVFAVGDVVLQCSYITQHSDIHIQLEPFTLSTKGKVYREKSIIGNVSNFDNDTNVLDIEFDNGTSIYFDKLKGLSIFTVKIEGENVYSFGSCMKI